MDEATLEKQRKLSSVLNKATIYTGIGSRATPVNVLKMMSLIAFAMVKHNSAVLRSGGADGADSAFEYGHVVKRQGFLIEYGKKQIFLPWKEFNKNSSILYPPSPKAFKIAEGLHPAWNKLSSGAQKLHARNAHQVLGERLDCPSDVLICWTPNAEDVGGTATAIKLARQNNIPIVNLADPDYYHYFKQILNRISLESADKWLNIKYPGTEL